MSKVKVHYEDIQNLFRGAVDDWHAIQLWMELLQVKAASKATLATYEREVRRLRWYCEHFDAPPPRVWGYADVIAYLKFLQEGAKDHPCRQGARPGTAGWTPFRSGNLSPAAAAAAARILNTLFGVWLRARYIGANPFAEVVTRPRRQGPGPRHAIPAQALDIVRRNMDERIKHSAFDHLVYWRNRFLLCLLERTGLRANEVAQANMQDIGTVTDPKTGRMYWVLHITHQKGGGEGDVVLDAVAMEALFAYRHAFGLPETPQPGENLALILSPRTGKGSDERPATSTRRRRRELRWLGVRTRQSIWSIVRKEFDEALSMLPKTSLERAILERASTHWLRHTRATTLALQVGNAYVVAQAMRHDDIRTTLQYTNLGILEVARALDPTPSI